MRNDDRLLTMVYASDKKGNIGIATRGIKILLVLVNLTNFNFAFFRKVSFS